MKKKRNILSKIREGIWPLLEPLEVEDIRQISEQDCKFNDSEIDTVLEYVEKYQDSEEKRKNEVETKSAIFIGSFSVSTAILLALTKDLMFSSNSGQSLILLFFICIITLAVIYLSRAIWFSIKALSRRNYYTTGVPGFMLDSSKEKKKQMIILKYNNTKKNQTQINIKVDYMTMAQAYFKRAIIVVGALSIVILANYILSYKMITLTIFQKLSSLNLSQVFMLIIFLVFIVMFVLIIVLFHKIKKINRPQQKE